MDRANNRQNLEALTEEDDEETEGLRDADDDSDSETDSSDEEGDSGMRRGEPNKFDTLCDGFLNALALVHSALKEVLDMKDELLQHALPPTVLIHLAMTTSKLYRSVSDLGMPANELIRLVRVYSTPWEEKSAALKKLHESYESKQRQLNIAIKRLQLVDAHSKRIAREKRIMNWEKLFAKLTSRKGHGRRWKFLIESIKHKASMGLEHVQAFTQALEESSESEEEDITTKQSGVGHTVNAKQTDESDTGDQEGQSGDDSGGGGGSNEEDNDDEGKDDEYDDSKEATEESGSERSTKFGSRERDVPTVTILLANDDSDGSESVPSRSGSPKKVRFEEQQTIAVVRPPMKDKNISTETPIYDRSLFVRIFCPGGLQEYSQIRCTLTCNGHIFKTGLLDSPAGEEEAEEPTALRPRAAGNVRRTPEGSQLPKTEETLKKSKRFKEFELKLPDEVAEGAIRLKGSVDDPENLQIAVHQGQYEEIFAMATIDFRDIKELPLKTVVLPPPTGDDEVLHSRSHAGSLSEFDDLSDSVDLILPDEEETQVAGVHRDDPAKEIDALPFPLYSLHAAKPDKPCAILPLVLYWGQRERPCKFNRQIGTLGVNDLVFELTGIDLSTTTIEYLHKETASRSVSAIAFTPEVVEETVAKAELEQLISHHQEELKALQEEYERRLQELVQSLQSVQEENMMLSRQKQQDILHPLSTGSRRSQVSRASSTGSPGPVTFHSPVVKKSVSPQMVTLEKTVSDMTSSDHSMPDGANSQFRPLPPRSQRTQRNFRIGRPLPKWGENLPQDFFERLHLFEEESRTHKKELNERTLREIKEDIEKKLGGQHKLSQREEQMYDALKDVSLPALFMPTKTGNIFNPRAHQYFHPTGSTEMRLTQPPSVFQLPPLSESNQISVVNLFELSKNFHNRGPEWLVERYIQQQQPLSAYPQTPAPTSSIRHPSAVHSDQQQSQPFMEQESPASPAMDRGSQSAHSVERQVEA